MAHKTKRCGFCPALQIHASHLPYVSNHSDGFIPSPFSSLALACFLCLESPNPQLFTRLEPCHCLGLKHHLLRSPQQKPCCLCSKSQTLVALEKHGCLVLTFFFGLISCHLFYLHCFRLGDRLRHLPGEF